MTIAQIRRLIKIVQDLTTWASRMPDLLSASLNGQGGILYSERMGQNFTACVLEYNRAGVWNTTSGSTPQEVRCVAQLTTLLDTFASTVLPQLMDKLMLLMLSVVGTLAHDRHQDAVTKLMLSGTLVLRGEDRTCPPLIKLCPALGKALHKYVLWMQCCTLTSVQADSTITMVCSSLMKCAPCRLFAIVPPAMVVDVLTTAASAYDRILYPRSQVTSNSAPANLMYLVMFRTNLRGITEPPPSVQLAENISRDTTAVAHLLGKLAFVAVARCAEPIPTQFFQVLLDNVRLMAVPCRPAALPTRFGNASVIRSLHECARRYPGCSMDCTRIIESLMPGKLEADAEDGAVALISTANHCVQQASQWIQRRVRDPGHPETGLHLLTTHANVLTSIAHLKGGDASNRAPCVRKLFLLLTVPGSLITLEALLRDKVLRKIPTSVVIALVRSAYSITDAATLLPLEHIAYRSLLSLNSTLNKLLHYLLRRRASEDLTYDLVCILTSTAAMVARMGKAIKQTHRLYILLCWCFPAVLARLRRDKVTVGSGTPASSVILTQILTDLGPGYLQRYSTRYSGELFCFCSNPACENLDGFSESTLRTQLCSGCRRARYCGVKCQKAHWLAGGHVHECA